MQIAPGLHRLGSDPHGTVNSYLVVEGGEVTVIDAGLPAYRRLLVDELGHLGLGLDAVRALVLTHGDTDHIGFAQWLWEEKGVPAHVHTSDVDRARLEVKKPNRGWGPVRVKPMAGFLWFSARHGGLRMRPVGGGVNPSSPPPRSTSTADPGSSTSRATPRAASRSTSRASTHCSWETR
jgi:glyoxylase-like metal-dependent hydrolase (beta-lactamase superfamily II)